MPQGIFIFKNKSQKKINFKFILRKLDITRFSGLEVLFLQSSNHKNKSQFSNKQHLIKYWNAQYYIDFAEIILKKKKATSPSKPLLQLYNVLFWGHLQCPRHFHLYFSITAIIKGCLYFPPLVDLRVFKSLQEFKCHL